METHTVPAVDRDAPFAIVQIKEQPFAIPLKHLQEMIVLPPVTQVPSAPPFVRGVINLRGRVLPLVDLRKRMNWTTAAEDTTAICALMEQREQDHQNWLSELEASVHEGRPFKLTTDPHKCAFGRWYDSFHTENVALACLLKRFDAPHQAIHREGAEIVRMMESGDRQKAESQLQSIRVFILSVLQRLFAEVRAQFRECNRETVAILHTPQAEFGITLDEAVSVEKLIPESIQPLPPHAACSHHNIVQHLGARASTNETVLILEPEEIV